MSETNETFNERFKAVTSKHMELNTFATPFNVESTDKPDNLQEEIIQLQSSDELKVRYNHLPLLEFCKHSISRDEFPTLRRHALKYASVFRTTYCCEQFFPKPPIAKSGLCSRLSEAKLVKQLPVATSSTPAHITGLAKEKQFQPPH
uniref:Uncharacterized protein n=1 Tax=Molossus molossus TaxID=27622 RepID=A0A7J8J6B9_MOLMO|nr:hypothetical protein HJG59_009578 [Molossus molossus]